MSDKDMVYFLMPDGTKVSNDPRFGLEEALQTIQDNTEYTGDAGIHPEDQTAQTQVEHPATLNSGQPGVGENAVPDDATRDLHGPMGSPAQQRQVEDMQKAKEADASPNNPTVVEDTEPVDSNQAVLDARAERQDRQRKAQEALEKAGGPGDPNEPYSEWTNAQIKAEFAVRNAQEDRAEDDRLTMPRKKSEAVELLEQDDQRTASA